MKLDFSKLTNPELNKLAAKIKRKARYEASINGRLSEVEMNAILTDTGYWDCIEERNRRKAKGMGIDEKF